MHHTNPKHSTPIQTNNNTSTGCNTNKDLNSLKDICMNTINHERNISTMTTKTHSSQMRDSTSSTSNELGIMTNRIKIKPSNMVDIANEAKDECTVGVMATKGKKKTSNSECNTQVHESEVGISCKMQELVCKRDTECDAYQFEQSKGINTTRKNVSVEKDISTITNTKTDYATNTLVIEERACATMTNLNAIKSKTDSTINTEINEENRGVMTNEGIRNMKTDSTINTEINEENRGVMTNAANFKTDSTINTEINEENRGVMTNIYYTNEVSTTTKQPTNDYHQFTHNNCSTNTNVILKDSQVMTEYNINKMNNTN